MNAHVFLLALVTGFFMAAWNGDQATKPTVTIAVESDGLTSGTPVVPRDRSENDSSRRPSTVVPVGLHTSVTPDRSVCRSLPQKPSTVPRPDSMAAGCYRAVSQSGDTQTLTIDSESGSGTAPRDFYIADDSQGNRWYLIRLPE